MGRKKKEIDETALKKTSERVKALKESLGLTYKGLADYLDGSVCESTLRNYVRCRSSMERKTAQTLYEKTGVIPEYWTGACDEKTWGEYFAALTDAMDSAVDEIEKEQERMRTTLRQFFGRLGFEYTDISATPEYAFGPRRPEGPHRLTRLDFPTLSARFTDDELDALFSKLGDVVELECYKKMKGAKPQ